MKIEIEVFSVDEKLPESGKEVLVFTKTQIWYSARRFNDWFKLVGNSGEIFNVTHWCELPDLNKNA